MATATVRKVAQVRTEYTSARLICSNLEHRAAGARFPRLPGYLAPEVDYVAADGTSRSLAVRDYDVRYLDRVAEARAAEHLALILRARAEDREARKELSRRTAETSKKISARFAGARLTENDQVIPYTTTRIFSETHISNKGSILLDLSRFGIATADFSLLAAGAYGQPERVRAEHLRNTIANLEILSGRRLEDPSNPLLIAMRSAMPEYIPGFMPTFLNVGLTPPMFPGLPHRYGPEAAARIRLSNRKTILEALDPESFRSLEAEIRHDLSIHENEALALRVESLIQSRNPRLLVSAHEQVAFFLAKTYEYYDTHFDALRNFMVREIHTPTVIFQRMVCSVIDDQSYAGVLYSRHPRLGMGVFLQFARTIFGEDLMTGRLPAEERHFRDREEARAKFPAVYHFWPRLAQLEAIFHAPVMVEFTGVHGTFTVLQVNPAELAGAGMITAVIDMHKAGKVSADRVRELVKPYHVRQIESDAIDPKSLRSLTPFCTGISVLPRSAVSGKVYFSGARARQAREERGGEKAILVKERFTPQDAIDMQQVGGICSLSPAAIHVVTTAQNLGIPALLNLEESGVRIDQESRTMTSRDGRVVQEGDWVTLSSRMKTLYLGKAVFAPARLLRFMAGEAVELTPEERVRFENLAAVYREYRRILETADASAFASLQDLGHAIRYGRLKSDQAHASAFVNQCFDVNGDALARRLLDVTLGTHLINLAAFELLSVDRQVRLLRAALSLCRDKDISGYQAGAFVIGSLVKPEAPAAFWKGFAPSEVGSLINEWVLHQKYMAILDDMGERKVSRAREFILSQGLGSLSIHKGLVRDFLTLKLSRPDLGETWRSLADGSDPQTAEVLGWLLKPYGELFDYADPRSLAKLKQACESEGLPLPDPQEV